MHKSDQVHQAVSTLDGATRGLTPDAAIGNTAAPTGVEAPGFTPAQIAAWKAYERVRKGGNWNMYDPRARKATRLDSDSYVFVMRNYSALKTAATREQA